MMTDWSRSGSWDDTMMYARTFLGETWDGRFEARCPHGDIAVWISAPAKNPYPICLCGGI